MFEKLTDRARKVMAFANQEAQRLNHEHIGTEHVLLGLLKEGSGVGATVLKNYDIDLEEVRLEIEKSVKSGPDIVTMGKLPQTSRAKKVIEYAIGCARELNHDYIGTEHILYGLITEKDGVAAQILMNNNLNEDKIKKGIEDLLRIDSKLKDAEASTQGYWIVPKDKMKFTEFLKKLGYPVLHITANPKCFTIMGRKYNKEIGKIGFDNTHPVIDYDSDNLEQINEALELRDLFDKNKVKYNEEPSALEVAEKLKASITGTTSLIDRLEGIV